VEGLRRKLSSKAGEAVESAVVGRRREADCSLSRSVPTRKGFGLGCRRKIVLKADTRRAPTSRP
jgi:hypothetical protein